MSGEEWVGFIGSLVAGIVTMWRMSVAVKSARERRREVEEHMGQIAEGVVEIRRDIGRTREEVKEIKGRVSGVERQLK